MISLSPATSTMPKVEGTQVSLMPMVYMGGMTNRLYPDRIKNSLGCLTQTNWSYFDPDHVDELSAQMLSGGVTKFIFDWERPDTEHEREVYLRTVWRFQDRGLRPYYFGSDPSRDRLYVSQNPSNELYAPWYQYTLDVNLWLRQRTESLDAVRQQWPDHKITAILCPYHYADGDGPDNAPIPVGQYVGRDMWTRQLAWTKLHRINTLIWMAKFTGPVLTGDYAPFDETEEWWVIAKEFAKK